MAYYGVVLAYGSDGLTAESPGADTSEVIVNLRAISLYCKRVGANTSYNVVLELYGNTTTLLATVTKPVSELPEDADWVNFRFDPIIDIADYTTTEFKVTQDGGDSQNHVIIYHQSGYTHTGSVVVGTTYQDSEVPPNTIPECTPSTYNAAAFVHYSALNETSSFGTGGLTLNEITAEAQTISLAPGFPQAITDTPKAMFVRNNQALTANIGLRTHIQSMVVISTGASPYTSTLLAACPDGIYQSTNSGSNWTRISEDVATAISIDSLDGTIALAGTDSIVRFYLTATDITSGTVFAQTAAYPSNIERLLLLNGVTFACLQDAIYVDTVEIAAGLDLTTVAGWSIKDSGDDVFFCTDGGLVIYDTVLETAQLVLSGEDIRDIAWLGAKAFILSDGGLKSTEDMTTFTDLSPVGITGHMQCIATDQTNSIILIGADQGVYRSEDGAYIFQRADGGENLFYHALFPIDDDTFIGNVLSFGDSPYQYDFIIDASGSQAADMEEVAQEIAEAIALAGDKSFCSASQRPNSYFQPVPNTLLQTRIYEVATEGPSDEAITEITSGPTALRHAIDGGYFLLSSRREFATFDGAVISSKDTDQYYRTILISDKDGFPAIYIDGAETGHPVTADPSSIIDYVLPKFTKQFALAYKFDETTEINSLSAATSIDGDTAEVSSIKISLDNEEITGASFPVSINSTSKKFVANITVISRSYEHQVVLESPQLSTSNYDSHLVVTNITPQDCVQYFAALDGDNAKITERLFTVTDTADYDEIELSPKGGAALLKSYTAIWLDEQDTVNDRPALPQVSSTAGDEALAISVTSTVTGSTDLAINENNATFKLTLIAGEGITQGSKISVSTGLGETGAWSVSPSGGITQTSDSEFLANGFFSQGTVLTFSKTVMLRRDAGSQTAEDITTWPDSGSPQLLWGTATATVTKPNGDVSANSTLWQASIERGSFTHVHVAGAIIQDSLSATFDITLCDAYGRISRGGDESIDLTLQAPGVDPVNETISFAESDAGTKQVTITVPAAGAYKVTAQGLTTFAPTFHIGEASPVDYNPYFGDPFASSGNDFAESVSGLDWTGLPASEKGTSTAGDYISLEKFQGEMDSGSRVCIIGTEEAAFSMPGTIESLSTNLKSSQAIAIVRHPAHEEHGMDWALAGDITGISGADIYSFHGACEKIEATGPLVMPGGKAGRYVVDALKAGKKVAFFAGSGDGSIYPGLMASNMPVDRSASQPSVNNRGLTCVYANSLSESQLLSAMKSGRTMATTGARMNCVIRIAGRHMGDEMTVIKSTMTQFSTPINVEVYCEPTSATAQVEIILVKSGGQAQSLAIVPVIRGSGWLSAGTFDSTLIGLGKGDYAIYAKALQSDGHTAFVSPIYIHHA